MNADQNEKLTTDLHWSGDCRNRASSPWSRGIGKPKIYHGGTETLRNQR